MRAGRQAVQTMRLAIDSMGTYMQMMSTRHGPDSEQVKRMEQRRERLKQAKQAGQPWVDGGDAPRLTRADIARRNGRLLRFKGRVALITDGGCAAGGAVRPRFSSRSA